MSCMYYVLSPEKYIELGHMYGIQYPSSAERYINADIADICMVFNIHFVLRDVLKLT